MEILNYDDLHQGGFAGLLERRFVTDRRVFGRHKRDETANGIGNFVYLADANFLPHGETGMHPHHEIDVISVMVNGRIQHAGSLGHGMDLETGMVQVQRAGADGFTLVNTIPGSLYEDSGEGAGQARLGYGRGGVSGPALLPIGVLCTRVVKEHTGLPVIGVGGVRTLGDLEQYLRAGASLVAVGTAALADPRLPERIARQWRQRG